MRGGGGGWGVFMLNVIDNLFSHNLRLIIIVICWSQCFYSHNLAKVFTFN